MMSQKKKKLQNWQGRWKLKKTVKKDVNLQKQNDEKNGNAQKQQKTMQKIETYRNSENDKNCQRNTMKKMETYKKR